MSQNDGAKKKPAAEPHEDPRLDPRLHTLLGYFASMRGTKVKRIDEVTMDWAQLARSANRNKDRLLAVQAYNMQEHDMQLAVAPKSAVVRTDGTFASSFGGNIVRCVIEVAVCAYADASTPLGPAQRNPLFQLLFFVGQLTAPELVTHAQRSHRIFRFSAVTLRETRCGARMPPRQQTGTAFFGRHTCPAEPCSRASTTRTAAA